MEVEGESVSVKQGAWPLSSVRQPEFEDAKRVAAKLKKPLREVQKKAKEAK